MEQQTTMTEHTHTNGHATETTSKKPNPGYIAFVSYFKNSGEASDTSSPEQLHAKTRTELAKLLTDPRIEKIHTVVKGRTVPFNTARKITF